MSTRIVRHATIFCGLLLAALLPTLRAADTQAPPQILAHVMPWYAAKPISGVWGWHWTMNHFDPERITNGRREIASALYPVIGPYDSSDTSVLEYHLLLMKLAGTDGIIIWKMLGSRDNKGIRIVPHGKEETFLPWNGFGDTGKLWANLMDCVKTREKPFSSIDLAVRVQAPLSMGVISHLENKVAMFDFEKQAITLS